MTKRIIAFALTQALAVGWVLHFLYLHPKPVGHSGHHATQTASPLTHYLLDVAVSAPVAVVVVALVTVTLRRLLSRWDASALRVQVLFAAGTAAALGLVAVPVTPGPALVSARYTFALAIGWVLLFGVPWQPRSREPHNESAVLVAA